MQRFGCWIRERSSLWYWWHWRGSPLLHPPASSGTWSLLSRTTLSDTLWVRFHCLIDTFFSTCAKTSLTELLDSGSKIRQLEKGNFGFASGNHFIHMSIYTLHQFWGLRNQQVFFLEFLLKFNKYSYRFSTFFRRVFFFIKEEEFSLVFEQSYFQKLICTSKTMRLKFVQALTLLFGSSLFSCVCIIIQAQANFQRKLMIFPWIRLKYTSCLQDDKKLIAEASK